MPPRLSPPTCATCDEPMAHDLSCCFWVCPNDHRLSAYVFASRMTAAERADLMRRPFSITRSGGRGWSGASFAHLDLGLRFNRRSVYYEADDRSTPYPEGVSDAYPKPE